MKTLLFIFVIVALSSCIVGPDYDEISFVSTDGLNNPAYFISNEHWYLQAYFYQGSWLSNFETERINIVFNPKYLYGFSGCNVLSAEYKLSDNHINLAKIEHTNKVCQSRGNVIMQTEKHFLEVLKTIETYETDSKLLIFSNIQGKRILVFKKKTELK